jgi:hypothetical protein
MALTRAQLLMGDSSQGSILPGQVQAVKEGNGITILSDGTIEIDSQTIVGVMKLGQTPAAALGAYNFYNWPTTTGSVGQQITITAVGGGVTTLNWSDPDQIPWTAKGQLVVGTGNDTQTILNVGTNGQILIADSSTPSGLNYTSNFVSTTGATGAANIPAGTTIQQPASPATGAFRYNSDTTSLEFWNGSGWETVASSTANGFVEKTSSTGSAVMPAGTQAQRDGSPLAGFLRFNDDSDKFEFWDGFSWQTIGSSSGGSFVAQTVPTAGTPSAVLPSGTTAQQQSLPTPLGGYLRYNTSDFYPEFYNGTRWVSVSGGIPDLGLNLEAANSLVKAKTPTQTTPPAVGIGAGQAIDGSLYWDTQYGALFVRYADANSSQWVMINGNNVQTGTLDFPNAPGPGATYAAPNGLTYTYDGTKGVWTCPAGAQLGLGLALNGGFIKVSIPVASIPPTAGTAQNQAMDGSLYWDDTLGALFIRYNDGTTTQWVQAIPSGGGGGGGGTVTSVTGTLPITVATGTTTPVIAINAATTAAPGSVQLATAAEAAAGTDATKALTPATGVPKDAAGMTGAAIIPSGTNAQRAAITPLVVGMQRFNTDSGYEEVYTGATLGWRKLQWLPVAPSGLSDLVVSANGPLPSGVYNNVTINAGVTATVTALAKIYAYGNVTINGNINGNGQGSGGGGINVGTSVVYGNFTNDGAGPGGGKIRGLGASTEIQSLSYSPVALFGSGGAAGITTFAGGNGEGLSIGGSSGATLMIYCLGTLTVAGTSTISMAGGTGSTASSGSGQVSGSGGGSGGMIYLQGKNLSLSGNLNVSGGNGTNAIFNYRGGSGGGGGYIILNYEGTISDTSTKNLAGGTVGATASLIPGGAGPGGSFGGNGGVNTSAGSTGVVLTNYYI